MSAHIGPSLYETGIAARPDGMVDRHYCYPGSLVLLPTGRLMAVFTAQSEGAPSRSVGVYSADGGMTWSPPVTLFGGPERSDSSIDTGEGYGDPNLVVVNEKRVIVFCVSLRYVPGGLDLSRTRFWRRMSEDGGETFGPVAEMPRHKQYYVGTVHAGMRLRNGTLAMGYSWDIPAENGAPADGEGTMDGVSGVLISRDEGLTWQPGGDLHANVPRGPQALAHATNGLDEPAVVELPNGDLFVLTRTCDSRLWQSFSRDGGQTWEPAAPSPLVSHNCPAALLRLAGDDAVLAVYNNHPQQRVRLSASISADGCRTWSPPALLAPLDSPDEPEVSYPAACQLPDGTIVAVFGHIQRGEPDATFMIRCVRFNRAYVRA